ncbi:MAG: energy transducer TonB [Ekhidna sp.]
MKKIASLLITSAFILSASAMSGKGELAKISNYTEVISKIEYPQQSKEQGIEGKVLVSIDIDALGNVKGYKFLSSPCQNLTEAVEKSIKNLEFLPAKDKTGKAISGKVVLPVDFKLNL